MSKKRKQSALPPENAAVGQQPIKLISRKEVCARIDRSRWWLRDQLLAGAFPKPLPVIDRFVEAEVDDWLRARMAER